MPEINLVPFLPQDDNAKYAMAQIAREGETPLLPDRYIRDGVLNIQSVDMVADQLREQQAERLSPVALLYSIIQALIRQGRYDLASIYMLDLQKMIAAQQQTAVPGGPAQGQGAPIGSTGSAPEVLSNAAQGVPPPAPTPQIGPNVPPGMPRPGARGGPGAETALSQLGLFYGR